MFKKKKSEDKTDKKEKIDLPFYEKMVNDLIASHGLDPENAGIAPKHYGQHTAVQHSSILRSFH